MAHTLYTLMNTYIYFLVPLIAWLVSGSLKFLINSLKFRGFAFQQIGYGGMPSTHTAMVSSITTFIAFDSGIQTPVFGMAFTFMLIVMIDATGLRMQMGHHAKTLNRLVDTSKLRARLLRYARNDGRVGFLREKMGHQSHEIVAGLLVGFGVGWMMHLLR